MEGLRNISIEIDRIRNAFHSEIVKLPCPPTTNITEHIKFVADLEKIKKTYYSELQTLICILNAEREIYCRDNTIEVKKRVSDTAKRVQRKEPVSESDIDEMVHFSILLSKKS